MQTLYTDIANGRIQLQTGAQPNRNCFYPATDVVLDSDTINKKGVAQFENRLQL